MKGQDVRDLPSLTGLRGVAALWVLAFHLVKICGQGGAAWPAHASFLNFGWTGVDLFFVLSGFVLMWTHGAALARPTPAAIRQFAVARIVRVYPLSLAVLALILALAAADPVYAAWFRDQSPGNFSVAALTRTALLATRWVPNAQGEWNEPVWSLSAELIGYAAFPLLAWMIARCSEKTAVAAAASSLAAMAAFMLLTGLAGSNPIDQIPALMRMATGLIAGMAACRLRQTIGPSAPADAGLGALATCLALGVALRFSKGVLFAPTAFTLLIFCLSFGHGVLHRALTSKPVMMLGRISFPLYLVHLTPLAWLASHVRFGDLSAVDTLILLGGYLAFCLGLAGLLHYAVERPLHRWVRRGAEFSSAPVSAAQAA
ncbi:MAG TPA: acyltransferase [Caulobacteraceae bacterium]|nr:acyltransferase [Caulobacteraceae bacterium]